MRREETLDDEDENSIIFEQSIKSKIWTAIPGIIQSVNYQKFTAEIQPAIQGRIENQDGDTEDVNMPILPDVPILLPNAGGWHMTFPIKPGDECLVVFAARCIDAWWQNGGVQKAIERRMHDLSDGFAIIAPYSQPLASECVEGFSDSSVIIRDDQKQNYIEITNEGKLNILHQSDLDYDTLGNADITIKGNVTVNIDGASTVNIKGTSDITVGGNVTLTASNVNVKASSLTIDSPTSTFTGNVSVGGGLSVAGSSTIQGSVTANGDVTGSGISLSSHKHSGVQGGSSTTGGPI